MTMPRALQKSIDCYEQFRQELLNLSAHKRAEMFPDEKRKMTLKFFAMQKEASVLLNYVYEAASLPKKPAWLTVTLQRLARQDLESRGDGYTAIRILDRLVSLRRFHQEMERPQT